MLAWWTAAVTLAAAEPSWPRDLVRGTTAIEVERRRGAEPPRSARVLLERGVWRMVSPRRGEADVDAVRRLLFTLSAPQVVRALPAAPDAAPAFAIRLERGRTSRRVTVWDAPIGEPAAVAVEGAGVFAVSPVELGTKIPDPQDFLPPGLWPSAHGRARSLRVDGPLRYALRRRPGGEWVADREEPALRSLAAVPRVVTGRNAVGVPLEGAVDLGLDPPTATAVMCARAPSAARDECRTFRFGAAVVAGQRRTFAVGPRMDPVELRDDEWRLLVEGPFARRRPAGADQTTRQ